MNKFCKITVKTRRVFQREREEIEVDLLFHELPFLRNRNYRNYKIAVNHCQSVNQLGSKFTVANVQFATSSRTFAPDKNNKSKFAPSTFGPFS